VLVPNPEGRLKPEMYAAAQIDRGVYRKALFQALHNFNFTVAARAGADGAGFDFGIPSRSPRRSRRAGP
jgi:hypothetical protein